MITTIKIKGITTFQEEVIITNLKKVNFIYGANGSGKSTIAKFLYNTSLSDAEKNPDFANCVQEGYDHNNCQILVFDEMFIESNFRNQNELKGIFSLNQKNDIIDKKIKEEEISKKDSEKSILKYDTKIGQLNKDKAAKEELIKNICWSKRNEFSAFKKIALAHSGSKLNHYNAVKSCLPTTSPVTSFAELLISYKRLYESDLKEITSNIEKKRYEEIRTIEEQLNILLQEIIVGNEDVDIAALITKLNNRGWVERGLLFIEQGVDTCPFCQKSTIDADLRHQFAEFFDETYKAKIEEICRLKAIYSQKMTDFVYTLQSIQSEFNPANNVSDLIIELNDLKIGNENIIDYKLSHSNERKIILSINTKREKLSNIKKQINNNNRSYSSIVSDKKILTTNIWNYLAVQCEQAITEFQERELKYSRILQLASDLKQYYSHRISESNRQIEILRAQTINTVEAVENINGILKASGFEGFEIKEKEKVNNISRYYLRRNNSSSEKSVFKSLSEGEKNFISFLYFYQLCLGVDDIKLNGTKKKIIIIDDPVSSLDSQTLFIVSTLIHQLIKQKGNTTRPDRTAFKNDGIEQVFIFTHNLYFYKEVSFEKRPICTNYWHYRITKTNNQTRIIGGRDKTIYDDYSMLWNIIKDTKQGGADKSQNIIIANVMRRIIDSYVNFMGLGTDAWGALIENAEDPNYYVKCAFISTINDDSHKVTPFDSVYYQKIANEEPNVLFESFEEIFLSIGAEHYNKMMGTSLAE